MFFILVSIYSSHSLSCFNAVAKQTSCVHCFYGLQAFIHLFTVPTMVCSRMSNLSISDDSIFFSPGCLLPSPVFWLPSVHWVSTKPKYSLQTLSHLSHAANTTSSFQTADSTMAFYDQIQMISLKPRCDEHWIWEWKDHVLHLVLHSPVFGQPLHFVTFITIMGTLPLS